MHKKKERVDPLNLHGGKHSRAPPSTLDLLLHLDPSPVNLDLLPRRDLEPMHLLLALLPEEAQALFALYFGGLVQRLDVGRIRVVVPLACADLVELVVAPEDDVAAPVGVVDGEGARARCARGDGDRGDVIHDGGGVGGANGHVR